MNIIFLDIDGVLNTERFQKYQVKYGECDDFEANFNFDPICMKNLKELINKTNSYIVLSSSWRHGNPRFIDEVFNNLKLYDMKERFFSTTPLLRDKSRGEEISSWLNSFSDMNVNYVILDDEDNVGIHMDRLVKCDEYYGFTKDKLNEALRILERDV